MTLADQSPRDVDRLLLARSYWASGRISRALAAVDAAVAVAPDDPEPAELRADILRSQGDRQEWERRGHDLDPPAARLFTPGRYVAISRFIDAELQSRLRSLVKEHREAFGAALVGPGTLDLEKRRSLRLRNDAAEDVARRWFLPRLEAALPSLFERLAPEAGPVTRIECKVTAAPTGGFFAPHRDNRRHEEEDASNHDRILSYVSWFHREPACFGGGDLVLHDSSGSRYNLVSCTRFPPVAGTLVVFPSRWFHSVRPVTGEVRDLLDARLAISGHIRVQDHGSGPDV